MSRVETIAEGFNVVIDHDKKVISIQGINYTFSLFDHVAFAAKGTRFEIGDRGDGTVTLHTVPANQ